MRNKLNPSRIVGLLFLLYLKHKKRRDWDSSAFYSWDKDRRLWRHRHRHRHQSEIKQNTNLWRWVGRRNFATASLRRQSLLLRLANINFKWNTTVGRTHALSWVNPLSPKPMDSKPDGCDLPHFNRPSNRQPTWTETERPPLLIQL